MRRKILQQILATNGGMLRNKQAGDPWKLAI